MVVIQHALAGCDETTARVAVLGMGYGQPVGEKIDGLRDEVALLGRACGFEQVGRVEDDFQARALQRIDQPPCLGGAVDDIGDLRLDAEIDVMALGDGDGGFHRAQQVAPSFGRCIVRVVPPLVVRVARAGAERHEARPHVARLRGDHIQPAVPGLALRRIGMDHVVGAGDGDDLDAALPRSICHGERRFRGDVLRHGVEPGTGHVVLRGRKTGRLYRREHRGRIAAGKGFGKDAEPHHTPPPTSASATARPLSTERAIATMARTEARPS